MKKLVAGILILVLVLGLVACGGGGNDPQPTPQPTPEATPQATEEPTPQATEESAANEASLLVGVWEGIYIDDEPSAEFIELANSFSAIRDNPDAHDEFRERMPDMGFHIFLTNAFLDGTISVREILSAVDYTYIFNADGTGTVHDGGFNAGLTWSAEDGFLTIIVDGEEPEVIAYLITYSDYFYDSRLVFLNVAGGTVWRDEFVRIL